jgi:hypothetical protein
MECTSARSSPLLAPVLRRTARYPRLHETRLDSVWDEYSHGGSAASASATKLPRGVVSETRRPSAWDWEWVDDRRDGARAAAPHSHAAAP